MATQAFNYPNYLRVFNQHNDKAFVNEFFATNSVVDHGDGHPYNGSAAWLQYLTNFHREASEHLDAVAYLESPTRVLSELVSSLVAQEDIANYPNLGALKKGDRFTIHFFCDYTITNNLT